VKIWLDDERPAPAGWVHVKTAPEAIVMLAAGGVAEVSLDHDLGRPEAEVGTGYDVMLALEEMAAMGQGHLVPGVIRIHTANSAARSRMQAARASIERFLRGKHV
jgi:hypothetical protein